MVYDLRYFVIFVCNNRAFRSLYWSIEFFSSFLAMAGVEYQYEYQYGEFVCGDWGLKG